jgi:hypothetical protein
MARNGVNGRHLKIESSDKSNDENPEYEVPDFQEAYDDISMQQPVGPSDAPNVQEAKPAEVTQGMPHAVLNSSQSQKKCSFELALIGAVKDDSMKNLMMAWYWAGYYTGYHEGEKAAKQAPT